MKKMTRLLLLPCLLAIVAPHVRAQDAGQRVASSAQPLVRAHAHNDYRHSRPLLDALDRGFCSVEADIFLVSGQLLVGHVPAELKPERTLQALYLDPLISETGNWRIRELPPMGLWTPYGYGPIPTTREYLDRYRDFFLALIAEHQCAGFCYVQLYDVEGEVNGYLTYDRKPKVPPGTIRAIHAEGLRARGP